MHGFESPLLWQLIIIPLKDYFPEHVVNEFVFVTHRQTRQMWDGERAFALVTQWNVISVGGGEDEYDNSQAPPEWDTLASRVTMCVTLCTCIILCAQHVTPTLTFTNVSEYYAKHLPSMESRTPLTKLLRLIVCLTVIDQFNTVPLKIIHIIKPILSDGTASVPGTSETDA